MNYTMHIKYFIEMYNETSKEKLLDLTQSHKVHSGSVLHIGILTCIDMIKILLKV